MKCEMREQSDWMSVSYSSDLCINELVVGLSDCSSELELFEEYRWHCWQVNLIIKSEMNCKGINAIDAYSTKSLYDSSESMNSFSLLKLFSCSRLAHSWVELIKVSSSMYSLEVWLEVSALR